jgi:hypothetical protein
MENDQRTIQMMAKNNSDNFLEVKIPAQNPVNYYEEIIHELDTIFDQIHGGRTARYYSCSSSIAT